MTAAGLFLRYCPVCNSTQTVAARQGTGLACGSCGNPLATIDAHALIPALGAKLDQGQREVALRALADRSLPST